MIYPTELRLNNYVSVFGQICQVFVIAEDRCQIRGDNMALISGSPFYYRHIEPILLTPELLEAAGFVLSTHQPFATVGTMYELDVSAHIKGSNKQAFTAVATKESCTAHFTVDDRWGANEITTLHQLQNCFYCLTGQELPITL